MADIKTAFVGLLPWRIASDFRAVIYALAKSIERLWIFFEGILAEADPATAQETIERWYEAEGLRFDNSLSIDRQQNELSRAFYGMGGQNHTYLSDEIHRVFPYITINYDPENPNYYDCLGIVEDRNENRLLSLLERIIPAHLEPIFDIERYVYLMSSSGAYLTTHDGKRLIGRRVL